MGVEGRRFALSEASMTAHKNQRDERETQDSRELDRDRELGASGGGDRADRQGEGVDHGEKDRK